MANAAGHGIMFNDLITNQVTELFAMFCFIVGGLTGYLMGVSNE